LEDRRIVYLGGEHAGRLSGCLVAESPAVQVGAGGEFAHPGSRCQGLERLLAVL